MKPKPRRHHRTVARGMLLGAGLLAAVSVRGQNLVKNPDFEQPLGPDNWTVVYVNCDPWDFLVAGRTTMAHRDMVPGTWDGGANGSTNYWSKLGGHFAPNYCNGLPEAYFKQVVSGLKPNFPYTASAWMAQYTRNDNYLSRSQVWMETLGGPTGTQSKVTPYVTANVNNNPAGWQRYVISNVVASAAGQIEIRLRYKFVQTIAQIWEYRNINAYYDHVALVPQIQPDPTPPYQITSFARAGQDLCLQWTTVMNNKYRIQVSPDLSNPEAWSFVQWHPRWDTNIYAPGTNYVFRTNLTALFSYDPSFDPEAPLFFRIYSEPYEP
jgi:hypothetical protein